jgi:surfeit locus 1 family protein
MDPAASGDATSRTPRSRRILVGAMLALVALFVALGTWQVQRLFWKLDLIARVDARVHADPVPASPASAWADVSAQEDEYRHVVATGIFDHAKTVLVQAVTTLGPGFWVVTPLRADDGSTILVNRGFVPADRADLAARAQGDVSGRVRITGLLRMSEPGGGFLRRNHPAADRWFSRDVRAIAAAKDLARVAPYFIDAGGAANPGGLPIGGLTVVRFTNNHLVYALTWYALAIMSVAGAFLVYRARTTRT